MAIEMSRFVGCLGCLRGVFMVEYTDKFIRMASTADNKRHQDELANFRDEQFQFIVDNAVKELPGGGAKVDLTAKVGAIDLISVETRNAIKAAITNHDLLFQRAYAIEIRNLKSPALASKRALEAVYGWHLFKDHEVSRDKMDADLVAKLGGDRLKNELDEFGTNERPELVVAAKYLADAEKSGLARGEAAGFMEKLLNDAFLDSVSDSELEGLTSKHAAAVKTQTSVKVTADFFAESDNFEDFLKAASKLGALVDGAGIEAGCDFQKMISDADNEVDDYKRRLDRLYKPHEPSNESIEIALSNKHKRLMKNAKLGKAKKVRSGFDEKAERTRIRGEYEDEKLKFDGEQDDLMKDLNEAKAKSL